MTISENNNESNKMKKDAALSRLKGEFRDVKKCANAFRHDPDVDWYCVIKMGTSIFKKAVRLIS